MKTFRALIWKDTLILMRDRQAIALLFIMPVIFIVFLSLALKRVYDEKIGLHLPVAIELQDQGSLGIAIAQHLRDASELTMVPGDGRDAPKAGITIPQGFTASILRSIKEEHNGEPDLKITWWAAPILDASYRSLVLSGIGHAVQAAIWQEVARSLPQTQGVPSVVSTLPDPKRFITEVPHGNNQLIIPSPLAQNVPGWSLFAMFFIVLPFAGGFLRERRNGTLDRVLIHNVSIFKIYTAKQLPYLIINTVQFLLMLVIGTVVMPLISDLELDIGVRSWPLIPTILVAAFTATSYAFAVATHVRTEEQASAFGAVSVIIMAVVGGLMVPHFVMPEFMQTLAHLSPLYWAHQACLGIILDNASLATVAPNILVLLTFSAIMQVLALSRAKRRS